MLPVEAEDLPLVEDEVVAVRLCLTVPEEPPAADLATIERAGVLAAAPAPAPTLVALAD